ncbi:hypothetical protein MGSAQ_003257 [marine sediment metagenome]|uniref:Uncharacterized protein n=1 Tax=marine sediment metagenome TaxID=412755 RepID=A0A1B6NPC7_9ZZZZ
MQLKRSRKVLLGFLVGRFLFIVCRHDFYQMFLIG